ncbi:MAG: methyl-accepting chemotaxis protein [Methanosarcinaceae archaeon]|nr:methyl-accepting chemotaxis protein [Methanosarcinaceae archaeon]
MNDLTGEDHITERERKQLFAALHTRLFWVGQEVPYHIEIDGRTCNLHEIVWELLNKKKITTADRKQIDKYISFLKEKAKEDELELRTEKLTGDEAKRLFDELSGLMRTIMDLKEIEEGTAKEKEKEFHEIFSRERVAEVRRWLEFLKKST